ncbi:Phosphatidylcholine-sterol acyltransferase (Lecithin-cholesterol acyltransferase)/ Phospholipase A [Fasciola gigantica]|uniref:Phosphatidylcholine-sterol acyltransferase (Lecithin-cholesterol acyltransferase)/ Phospholipase A n=1 Tax=Fasciola gigantica TaxID=46835 RepID=A0A504YB47_FASGI|nr:Phosphatidylcholine-sterol acyltransferase (Lecithin-cholesterol acyltransferase)/ Phospholipase A [Fasciola gigantica]
MVSGVQILQVILFIMFLLGIKCSEKYPIVLVPGDGGSQAYCDHKAKNQSFLIWVNLIYFFRPSWLEGYFNLVYDPATGNFSDTPECEVIFPGWGETWSIENLDTSRHSSTVYFEYLVSSLLLDPFYKSGVTLRGAPFDFRRSPNLNTGFSRKMTTLIEETFHNAGDKPVVLVGHSLGSLYCLAFLKKQSDTWKRKYVKSFLSVSGPLGGSVKALKIEASGDNFGLIVPSALSFRSVQRSMPSLAFLLPDPRLWPPTEKIILTPNKNYSAHDYKEFFDDINYQLGYEMLIKTKSSIDTLLGPTGIDELYCIYGSGLPTTYQMIYLPPTFYRSAFPDQYPTLVTGDGDGTVHMRSLQLCRFWPGVKSYELPGAEHLRIVGDSRLIDLLRQISGFSTS